MQTLHTGICISSASPVQQSVYSTLFPTGRLRTILANSKIIYNYACSYLFSFLSATVSKASDPPRPRAFLNPPGLQPKARIKLWLDNDGSEILKPSFMTRTLAVGRRQHGRSRLVGHRSAVDADVFVRRDAATADVQVRRALTSLQCIRRIIVSKTSC